MRGVMRYSILFILSLLAISCAKPHDGNQNCDPLKAHTTVEKHKCLERLQKEIERIDREVQEMERKNR